MKVAVLLDKEYYGFNLNEISGIEPDPNDSFNPDDSHNNSGNIFNHSI